MLEEEEKDEFVFILKNDLESLDQIEDRFRNSFYHNLDTLLSDIEALVVNTIRKRCLNSLAKIYLSNLLCKA